MDGWRIDIDRRREKSEREGERESLIERGTVR